MPLTSVVSGCYRQVYERLCINHRLLTLYNSVRHHNFIDKNINRNENNQQLYTSNMQQNIPHQRKPGKNLSSNR
jgi:hypothetical protein